jgi:hypothetical protein
MENPGSRNLEAMDAASIVKARDSKPVDDVFDLTLVHADVAEKALVQVKQGAVELLTPRMEKSAAEALAAKLAGGHWTHDYALTAQEARALGLPVKVGMPLEVIRLMSLYPQPIQRSGSSTCPSTCRVSDVSELRTAVPKTVGRFSSQNHRSAVTFALLHSPLS